MITPVLIDGTGTQGWGTYLFFAVLNALFVVSTLSILTRLANLGH